MLVNLGTPYADTAAAMEQAVSAATDAGTPWVLDPVAAGALGWRTEIARKLLSDSPTVLRGNASEVMALTGGAGGKGVESVDTPEAALDAAVELAGLHGTVVAVSGPVDHLTDGDRVVRVAQRPPAVDQGDRGRLRPRRDDGRLRRGAGRPAARRGRRHRDADRLRRRWRLPRPQARVRSRSRCSTSWPRSPRPTSRRTGAAELSRAWSSRRVDLPLYLVTDTALCGDFGVAATVAAAVTAGSPRCSCATRTRRTTSSCGSAGRWRRSWPAPACR